MRLFKNWLPYSPISGFPFQRPQQMYNCPLVTLSSTLLCLCHVGGISGYAYHTTPMPPQAAITAPPHHRETLSIFKARRANASFFPTRRTKSNIQHLSKCSLSDRQGRSLFAYHEKMVPRRESQEKIVNQKKA